MKPEIMKVRTVTVSGVLYFRQEDVANLITELAATEDTDVQTRMNQASVNLMKLKPVRFNDPELLRIQSTPTDKT